MSYRNMIDSNLRIAFKLLKDLVEDIYIEKITEASFDFETNEVVNNIERIYLQAIILDSSKNNSKTNSVRKQCLIKKSDVGTISVGDSFNYKNNIFKIVNSIKDDGSILLFDIEQEVANG